MRQSENKTDKALSPAADTNPIQLTWQHRYSHSLTCERLVHDELGLRRKVQSTESVEIIFILWCNVRDHDGVRRASQGVLQQPRQFAVSVWNAAGRAGVEGIHHFAECEERQVDGTALLQTDALVARAAVVLRPSQVDQVQLACLMAVGQGAQSSHNLTFLKDESTKGKKRKEKASQL